MPRLLSYVDAFGKLSGYTINWSKSEFMPLSKHTNPNHFGSLPFKLVEDHLTYLGLKIPKNPKHIFKLIFLSILIK